MADINIKRGIGKTIQFTITGDGAAVDVAGDTFSFVVKKHISDSSYEIEKEDADFDKIDASSGIVTINLSTTDTDIENGNYIAELKVVYTADTDVEKSQTWDLRVERSVHL